MKIVIGSDKSGFSLKEAVKKHLIDAGHMVEDCGTADLDHVKPFFETAPILAEKMQTILARMQVLKHGRNFIPLLKICKIQKCKYI